MVNKSWSLVLAAAILTGACGDSNSSMNPTAPSAVSAAAVQEAPGSAEGESGVTGNPKNNNGGGNNGNGNGNGRGPKDDRGNDQPAPPSTPGPSAPTPPSNTSPTNPGQSKVEIEGLISAVGSANITVNGQTILVPETAVISHGSRMLEFNDLHVADRVHVRATRVAASGSGLTATAATLEATQVMLQNPGGGDDDGEDPDPTALVSVSAFDASASEAGTNTGTFRLSRAGDLTLLGSPLTVTFTLTGTATNGTDYTTLPLTATFAAGSPTVEVVVTPMSDATAEPAETVILTLTSVAPYELGSPATATVTIVADTVSPVVSVTTLDATAAELGPDPGMFRLSRTGALTLPLTVTVAFTGTATNGTDYETLLTTVTFAAGSATANVFVIPVSDATAEGSETVILTVTDGAAYDVGTPAAATITIAG